MDSVPVVERSIRVFRSKTNAFYIEWCRTHLKDYLLPIWKEASLRSGEKRVPIRMLKCASSLQEKKTCPDLVLVLSL
jgi:hypothetical protein